MHLNNLPLEELRSKWAETWGKEPHGTMGRRMMTESIIFKNKERDSGGLKQEHQERLNELIKAYKHKSNNFDQTTQLKPGTQLVRTWKGIKYCVTVTRDGFEYDGLNYKSLSKIANDITGSRWNGWLFFGLKK